MSRPIIEVDGLGKVYRKGEIAGFLPALLSGRSGETGGDLARPSFWALKDVTFDVAPGEVLGVLGHNGAGKSTLLKILSRITDPTTGTATLRGRVASLLEVGTGFHDELTGRENIFLNGTILGLRRSEIVERFDEIVGFSGVESFIDTPVKHYSSGMRVRLAFAVAAHLDPEILIVDEVLAVGDVAFQKKCLDKMQEVVSRGRTIILVTHNLSFVKAICTRGLVLSAGSVLVHGSVDEALSAYLRQILDSDRRSALPQVGGRAPAFARVATVGAAGEPTERYRYDEEVRIRVTATNLASSPSVQLSVTIQDYWMNYVTTAVRALPASATARHDFTTTVSFAPMLMPGEYSVRVALFNDRREVHQVIEGACHFQVGPEGFPLAEHLGWIKSFVLLPSAWTDAEDAAGTAP